MAKNHSERTNKAEFQCGLCDKIYRHPNSLIDHVYSHSVASYFMCGICCIDFESLSEIKTHMKEHIQLDSLRFV